MSIKKINIKDVLPRKMPGRDIYDLITKDTVNSRQLSMEITRVKTGETVRPCHSHISEEIAFIMSGQGKVWVDENLSTLSKGDAILWPSKSKHFVKNTGKDDLVLLCVFSNPEYQKDYKVFNDIDVSDL